MTTLTDNQQVLTLANFLGSGQSIPVTSVMKMKVSQFNNPIDLRTVSFYRQKIDFNLIISVIEKSHHKGLR